MRLPVTSKEWVRVRITETQGYPIAPASGPVEIAFLTSTVEPIETDWRAAEWEGPAEPTRVARVLVGPGALVLAVGEYHIWYRFNDGTERPARRAAGQLSIGRP